MFGLSPARRQAASKTLRTTNAGSCRINGKRSEAADVDVPAFAEIEPWMTSREYVDRRQRQAPEAAVVRLDRAKRTLCDVYLTAFQHRQQLGTDRVEQLHLNIGIALRVAVQKIRNDTFQVLRGRCHLQHPGVPAPEQLRLLADGTGVVQETSAMAEQLLAFAGQKETAPDTIEKLEAELLLEIADLARQGRLCNAQAQRRLGDGAEFGNCDEVRVCRRSMSLPMPDRHGWLEELCIGRTNRRAKAGAWTSRK